MSPYIPHPMNPQGRGGHGHQTETGAVASPREAEPAFPQHPKVEVRVQRKFSAPYNRLANRTVCVPPGARVLGLSVWRRDITGTPEGRENHRGDSVRLARCLAQCRAFFSRRRTPMWAWALGRTMWREEKPGDVFVFNSTGVHHLKKSVSL